MLTAQDYALVAQDLKVTAEDAAILANAIDAYSSIGIGYTAIRAAQRKYLMKLPLTEEEVFYAEKADQLEDYAEWSPKFKGTNLFRGMVVDKATLESYNIGIAINMNGLSSWSGTEAVAVKYSTAPPDSDKIGVLFECVGGTKRGASIKHLARMEEEDEVIIPHGTEWMPHRIIAMIPRKVYRIIVEEN